MDEICGPLWEYNVAKVIVVDVSDDYRLMQAPMPSDFYPVLDEFYLPRFNIKEQLAKKNFADGYLYDWHESPVQADGSWYVGVVHSRMVSA